jgi:hypothetical protein
MRKTRRSRCGFSRPRIAAMFPTILSGGTMPKIFVRHSVKDYAEWKVAFDEREDLRLDYGFTRHWLHRDADDPSIVVVVLDTDDLGRAREFLSSDALKDAMRSAGVLGTPEVWVCTDVEDETRLRGPRPSTGTGVSPPVTH